MIERRYSKTVAVANHVVWTGREPIYVPFKLDGLLANNQEFGTFRVAGKDMYCHGFRADFDVPAGDAAVQCAVGLYTAGGVLVPSGRLYLNGVTSGGDKLFFNPIPMPVNSIWKFRVEIQSYNLLQEYWPQGLAVTYQLRYANGPVKTQLFITSDPQEGIGFDQVGETLVIE